MSAHAALKRGVNKFSNVLYKGVEMICVAMLLTVVIIVMLEVFLRYILNHGFPWIIEVGTLGLQYIAFAAMVLGVKYKLHIALLLVYNKLPAKARKILDKFSDLCILFFGFTICRYGYEVTTQMWQFTLPATQWSQGLTYIICVFAGAIIVYEAIVSLLGLSDESVTWKAAVPYSERENKKEGEVVV